MKVNFIRKFDQWVGIPICFLFSLGEFLRQGIFSSKKREGTPKKILIIKPFELGSIILSTPLIEQIQKSYPKAEIFFLTGERNQEIFSLFNILPKKNVITFKDDSILSLIFSLLKSIHQIRKIQIDTTIDLEFFSRFSMIIAYLTKASHRIGFDKFAFEGLYRGNLLTHKIQYNPHVHISQLYFSFHETLGMLNKNVPTSALTVPPQALNLLKFSPADDAIETIRHRLLKKKISLQDHIFLINPGEGLLPLREWPIDNFISLIEKILQDSKNKVILVGTLKCKDKAAQIIQKIQNPRIVNMTSQTSIVELLTLISLAKYLISNDSGMAHLGSLTSTRQIVLFGPEHPRVFAPLGDQVQIFHSQTLCSPCLSVYNQRKSLCKDNVCLKMITPESLWEAMID